eukprot:63285-Chlamydomonas_euryale.AAC.1
MSLGARFDGTRHACVCTRPTPPRRAARSSLRISVGLRWVWQVWTHTCEVYACAGLRRSSVIALSVYSMSTASVEL